MNVMMVGPDIDLVPGGMSSVMKNYINSGLSKKLNLIYISTNIESKLIKKLNWMIKGLVKYILNIRGVHIVHIHMAERGSFYRKSIYIIIAKLLKKKVVVHFHGAEFDEFYYEESNNIERKYITYILNKADTHIALGEEWKSKIKKYTSAPIIVLNNAVRTLKENVYTNKSVNITMLGRLERRKGTFDLLDIADEIISEFNTVNILLAGDGDLSKVKELVSTKVHKDNIKVFGWVNKEQIKEILSNTLIFTLPSYNEGMPMAILEAMSFGVPLVVSDVGGIPSVVEHNTNGYLIKAGDKSDLKESLLKLLHNKEKREYMSLNNFNKINNDFNLHKNIDKLYELYKKLYEDIKEG